MYRINKDTKAIKTNESGYFSAKIMENNKIIFSVHHPMGILDFNCLKHGASLDGRNESVKEFLQSNSKLPVPVVPMKGIFMFPTTSAKNDDCVWISYYQVKRFEKRNEMTYIYFRDKTGMYVNISCNQFDLQMKKTGQVIAELLRVIFY